MDGEAKVACFACRVGLALTFLQWLPKPATSQVPNLGRALRAMWSPGRGYPRPYVLVLAGRYSLFPHRVIWRDSLQNLTGFELNIG